MAGKEKSMGEEVREEGTAATDDEDDSQEASSVWDIDFQEL
jgi:hypothetical protein